MWIVIKRSAGNLIKRGNECRRRGGGWKSGEYLRFSCLRKRGRGNWDDPSWPKLRECEGRRGSSRLTKPMECLKIKERDESRCQELNGYQTRQ